MITYYLIKMIYDKMQYETDNELIIILSCVMVSCFSIPADIIIFPLQIITLIIFIIKKLIERIKQ